MCIMEVFESKVEPKRFHKRFLPNHFPFSTPNSGYCYRHILQVVCLLGSPDLLKFSQIEWAFPLLCMSQVCLCHRFWGCCQRTIHPYSWYVQFEAHVEPIIPQKHWNTCCIGLAYNINNDISGSVQFREFSEGHASMLKGDWGTSEPKELTPYTFNQYTEALSVSPIALLFSGSKNSY